MGVNLLMHFIFTVESSCVMNGIHKRHFIGRTTWMSSKFIQWISNHPRTSSNCSDGFTEFKTMDFLSTNKKPSRCLSLNCVFPSLAKYPNLSTCKRDTNHNLRETDSTPFLLITPRFCSTWSLTTYSSPFKWKMRSYNLSTSYFKMITSSLKKCILLRMRSQFMSPLKNYKKSTLKPASTTKSPEIMTKIKSIKKYKKEGTPQKSKTGSSLIKYSTSLSPKSKVEE